MLLGIDMGSSGCKGVLFDESGAALCRERVDYAPDAVGPDGCEMDPAVFEDAFRTVVRRIAARHAVRAIGISSHGETIIPVSADRSAAGRAIMNADNRAGPQASALTRRLGRERIYQITGQPPHPMYSLPKIMWLKKNRPEVYEHTAKLCGVPEYLMLRLGLSPITDYTIASRYMALDIRRHAWSEELLSAAEVSPSLLCEVGQAGQTYGVIPHSAAAELGLQDGVTIAPAGHDQPCGAFGAGLIKEGAVLSAGSYECLTVVSDRPADAEAALPFAFNTYCHVCPEAYVTLAFFPAGLSARVYSELWGLELEGGGWSGAPTGLLVTPHVIGACNPDWNPDARGAAYGFRPGMHRGQLMQAVYEGIASELRLNIHIIATILPVPECIRVHGGGAQRDWTLKLRADIAGRAFRRLEGSEAGCHGAALLAGVSAGIYKDYAEAAGTVRCREAVYAPDQAVGDMYAAQIEQYNQFRKGTCHAG